MNKLLHVCIYSPSLYKSTASSSLAHLSFLVLFLWSLLKYGSFGIELT